MLGTVIQDITTKSVWNSLPTSHLENRKKSRVTRVQLFGSTSLSDTNMVGSNAATCEHLKLCLSFSSLTVLCPLPIFSSSFFIKLLFSSFFFYCHICFYVSFSFSLPLFALSIIPSSYTIGSVI